MGRTQQNKGKQVLVSKDEIVKEGCYLREVQKGGQEEGEGDSQGEEARKGQI